MTRVPRRDRGQDLVEFALLLPLLLLLILGIVEFGMAVFAYNTVANAAREGARVGVVLPHDDAGNSDIIKAAVVERTGGLNLSPSNIAVTQTVTQTTVAVDYDHRLITGLIIRAAGGGSYVPLHSEATMRQER